MVKINNKKIRGKKDNSKIYEHNNKINSTGWIRLISVNLRDQCGRRHSALAHK